MLNLRTSIVCLLCIACVSSKALAQSYNIYEFDYSRIGTDYKIDAALMLSGFNKNGINVDPVFLDDNTLLIASNYFDKSQTDILKLDLSKKEIQRITNTEISEREPRKMTSSQHFSVLLKDKSSSQLHKYPLNLKDGGVTLCPTISNIQGYVFQSFDNLYYVDGEPFGKFSSYNTQEELRSVLLENVGTSSIHVDKYRNVFFVHKLNNTETLLKKYDVQRQEYKTYGKVVGGSTIVEYLNDHKMLAAVGSKIYIYNLASDSIWEEAFDLSAYGIKDIEQIVVNKSTLIVVEKS